MSIDGKGLFLLFQDGEDLVDVRQGKDFIDLDPGYLALLIYDNIGPLRGTVLIAKKPVGLGNGTSRPEIR